MKRRLFTLALFLLLGAVVNVAVAWGCILILLPQVEPENERMFIGEEPAAIIQAAFNLLPQPTPGQCIGFEDSRLGWSETTAIWVFDDDDPGKVIKISTLSAGWPAYGQLGQYLWADGEGQYKYAMMLPDVLRPLGRRRLVEFLPLRPIWPGFAFNTLFYAAILWLPIRGPFALRRHLRRKRGSKTIGIWSRRA